MIFIVDRVFHIDLHILFKNGVWHCCISKTHYTRMLGKINPTQKKQHKMPPIKQKEDATLSFIQRFIRPSCTAPGLRIGIWSWLDNQEIPSSDKWGFFSLCEGGRGCLFSSGPLKQREAEVYGWGYFHMRAWRTVATVLSMHAKNS